MEALSPEGYSYYFNSETGGEVLSRERPLTLHSHYLGPLTDLIAWSALQMHCWSVRSLGSVACVKKLRNVQLFRQWWIRGPIRSRLYRYIRLMDPFCNNKQKEAGQIRLRYFLKKCGIDRIVISHRSFVFISTNRLCWRKATWLAARCSQSNGRM